MIPTIANGEAPKGQYGTSPAEPAAIAEAVRQLRAQTPQQALGLGSQSGLLKASLQAAAGIGVLFAALTVGPYLWEKNNPPAATGGPPAAAENPNPPAEPGEPNPVAPAPSTPGPKQPATTTPVAGKQPDKLPKDPLGETGVKSGSPTLKDPFKTGIDDLPGLK